MMDEKIVLDFDDEDFIITVSPSLDENLRWTGEVRVSIKETQEINKRVLTKEGNVIKLNFNSNTDGSA